MNNEFHLVDILLATYNGAKYLSEQLDSIIAQNFKSWHIIVRDDLSSDNTLEILKNYASNFPGRITIVTDNHGNIGIKQNFSYLMQLSNAPYIMFCDQDDIWLPNKVNLTLQLMQHAEKIKPYGVPILAHTNLQVVNSRINLIDKSFWHFQNIDPKYNSLNRLLLQSTITGCTVMVNKPLLKLALPIPNNCIMHDWWIGLVATSFGFITYSYTPTVLYRQHSNNTIGAQAWSVKYIISRIFSKNNYSSDTTFQQADCFYAEYFKTLSEAQKKLILAYINLRKFNYFTRRKLIFKNRLYRQGWIRNLGLLLRI